MWKENKQVNSQPSSNEELKPCAHCGGLAAVGYGNGYHFINCTECLLSNVTICESAKLQKPDAIEDWNERPAEQSPSGNKELIRMLKGELAMKDARIEELKDALRESCESLEFVNNYMKYNHSGGHFESRCHQCKLIGKAERSIESCKLALKPKEPKE